MAKGTADIRCFTSDGLLQHHVPATCHRRVGGGEMRWMPRVTKGWVGGEGMYTWPREVWWGGDGHVAKGSMVGRAWPRGDEACGVRRVRFVLKLVMYRRRVPAAPPAEVHMPS